MIEGHCHCGKNGWGASMGRGIAPHPNCRTCIAVNLRLADPAPVAVVPARRFDGPDNWTDLPLDERCVADSWA